MRTVCAMLLAAVALLLAGCHTVGAKANDGAGPKIEVGGEVRVRASHYSR